MNPIMGSQTAITHWVYTEAGITKSLECGITRRQVGKPAESADGPTRCPKSWIANGWIREATPDEHAEWLKQG